MRWGEMQSSHMYIAESPAAVGHESSSSGTSVAQASAAGQPCEVTASPTEVQTLSWGCDAGNEQRGAGQAQELIEPSQRSGQQVAGGEHAAEAEGVAGSPPSPLLESGRKEGQAWRAAIVADKDGCLLRSH